MFTNSACSTDNLLVLIGLEAQPFNRSKRVVTLCFCSPTFKFSGRKAKVICLNLSDLPNRKIGNIKKKWCTGRSEIDLTNQPDLYEKPGLSGGQKGRPDKRCDMCELVVRLADTRADKSSVESSLLIFDKAASYFL